MSDQDEPKPRRLNIDDESQRYPLEKMTRAGRPYHETRDVQEAGGRIPPQATGVEQSVLGAMLIEREAIPRAIEILREDSFYNAKHQKVFGAMLSLFERGNPVDLITLTEELKRRGELDDVGGAYYLTELTTKVASAANVEYHARIIAEKSLLRKMIETMTGLIGRAYDASADAFEMLDEAEGEVFKISESSLRKPASTMNEILKETLARLESIHGRTGGITGVPSGFTRLDEMTGGWQPSDLIIIAARPSMGKTALSLAVARNAALHPENAVGVAYFSLEMSAQQLAQRLLTSEARVDAQAARTGRMSDDDWPRLARAAGRLSAAPIYIDDTPGLTVLEIRAKSRRLKSQYDIGLVVVDYLQLMHGTGGGKNSNREQEIAMISRSLKSLAKELNVPVIALSQLSRAVETRGGDKRPQLSDLRESGCLTGDTLVTRADTGARVHIRDLAGKSEFQVLALNTQTWKLEKATVSRAFSTGEKQVHRLTTQLGREIRATANHKFLTIEGWKRLDQLKPGEHMALPRVIPAPEACSMSEAEVALLGHLIGDGCTLPRHVIQYTTREEDLAQTVCDLATGMFGSEVKPRINRERQWLQVYLASTRRHTHGVYSPIREWLERLGIWGLRSYEKRVPDTVFQQPQALIARFLRHLWSTDGCVRMRQGKSPYPMIYYASSSEVLARDVQSLLIRLGINARLKRLSQGTKGRDQYHVSISGIPDIQRFASTVGAVGAYKQQALSQICQFLRDRPENTNRDVIPQQIWRSVVTPAMRMAGITHRDLHARLEMAYSGMTIFKQNVSRERASRIARAVSSPELQQLAESDVYWDQIRAIEPASVEEVFDLTVPGPHNFIANDVIVHNSIEQDADVVGFIYRPERYGITVDENGNSTEGMAEVIIGKQRNGPIGTVQLAFVHQHARFENLTTYYAEPGSGGAGDGYSMPPLPSPEGDAPF
ncbi:MAG TPA: replicative DNA helicase [Rhodothermales bacterium]|nr:replicative DNA helicase [Rhodothermales bacterium]